MSSLPTWNGTERVRPSLEPANAAVSCAGVAEWKIGELAKRSGKTTRALRLYEELGLLVPRGRSTGGFRLYGEDALERVRWIGQLQALGFTLQDIQKAIQATVGEPLPREAMSQIRKMFTDKLREVAEQIQGLRELQQEIAAALAYLESCQSCSVDETNGLHSTTAVCSSCAEHGDEKAPSLIKGLTENAANAVLSLDAPASASPAKSRV